MSLKLASQVRAARAFLGWTQDNLAIKSGVSLPSIKRIELMKGVLAVRLDTVEKLRIAFETAGIEFLNHDQPGVRLKRL